jgi:hypothetical protein
MDKKGLESLARNSQIKIKDEEIDFFLRSFEKVNIMLLNFSKLNINKKAKSMEKILNNSLSLRDLENIQKNYLTIKLNKEDIKRNAFIENEKFLFIKK